MNDFERLYFLFYRNIIVVISSKIKKGKKNYFGFLKFSLHKHEVKLNFSLISCFGVKTSQYKVQNYRILYGLKRINQFYIISCVNKHLVPYLKW